ncbi:hypothetical protein OG589_12360 [Sphaerisporangium sp. NBC_01403]
MKQDILIKQAPGLAVVAVRVMKVGMPRLTGRFLRGWSASS